MRKSIYLRMRKTGVIRVDVDVRRAGQKRAGKVCDLTYPANHDRLGEWLTVGEAMFELQHERHETHEKEIQTSCHKKSKAS